MSGRDEPIGSRYSGMHPRIATERLALLFALAPWYVLACPFLVMYCHSLKFGGRDGRADYRYFQWLAPMAAHSRQEFRRCDFG